MKPRNQLATVAVFAVLVGCEKSSDDQTKPASPGTSSQSSLTPKVPTVGEISSLDQPVATKANDAAPGSDMLALPNKDTFVATAEKKLTELNEKIGNLAKKTESVTGDAKAQMDQALNELKEQKTKASAAVEEMKKAAADAWQALKPGVEAALDELEKGYDKAKAKFS